MQPAKPTRPWQAVLVFIVFALTAIWLINVLNTGNPLWFLPLQPEYRPSRIVIHYYGTVATVTPDTPEYEQMAAALNQSLAEFKNSALINLGLSEATLQSYYEEEFIVVVNYGENIRFNTPVRMRNVNQLLIPIDGRHGGFGYVFMGHNDFWLAGVMAMTNSRPLVDALADTGYRAR